MAILRTNGFVQLRRGLQEHVADGSMSIYEAWLFIAILFNVDPKTGIWVGSAKFLADISHLNVRSCQRALRRLEDKQYIKRFQSPGKNGFFPIAVHNFECTDGSLTGLRLNAMGSVTPSALIYSSVADMSPVSTPVSTPPSTPVSTPLVKIETREQILDKELSPAFALLSPPNGNGHRHSARFTASEIDSIYQQYPRKKKPEDAKKAIRKALDNLDEENPVEALCARVIMYANSPAGRKDKVFIPYPASWFNAKSYLEDPKEWEH